jgi:adenine-specific DNA-methyltransferase
MDKQSSIRLLDETFGQNYNRDRFCRFVKEVFNRFDINVRTWGVWSQYEDYIERFSSLGTFHDKNDKIIEVLEVQLKKTSSRDRARTMQRNFIASFLKKYMKDAALIAFYGDDPSDWRFSFVKMDYTLVRSETGKVNIEKELTPAKRYSYLVGINEPNHTCRRQFVDFIVNEESCPVVSDIEDAFSIDTVTKEFFEKYKELVIDLKESLDQVMARDKRIVNEFREKGIESIDFAKKLLGQIVFLYFLQKKGWLGVEKDEEWGSGPRDFLRRLFGDIKRGIQPRIQYTNFFNEILEPLFYDALANPRPGDDGYYVHFNCKIPFLNGGLFEPMNDYDWAGPDITIENLVFEKIFETFDRFNFTVKEDEPLEKEVAVDPEMLGKVFENLLEVKERKDKGAFYTPREIVHYMCQQSLINYLQTNTDIKREDIELFIQYGDLALEFLIQDKGKQKKDVEEQFLIPVSISNNYRTIDRLLQEIKIVDPAVGSGAFPIGMMNEIVKARSILSVFFPDDEQKNRTNYNFKRETIEDSLYGVDIDFSAVEIAKLRFWLSLIVDETKIDTIKPLPNLDHKIMCGNSLLEEFEGIKLFDEKLLGSFKKNKQREIQEINEQIIALNTQLSKSRSFIERKKISSEIIKLKKKINNLEKKSATDQISLVETESEKKIKKLKSLQKKYFNEQNRDFKRELRAEIDKIEWELIEATLKEQNHEDALEQLDQYKKTKVKPFFLWKLYFAEVFQRENPGFDVVIANPPYLGEDSHKEIFRPIAQGNLSEFYQGKMDIFYFFLHLSLNIGRENSQITFITTNYYPTAFGAEKLRKDLKKRSIIRCLINFSELKIFESAKGQHNMITILTKGTQREFIARTCETKRKGDASSDNLNNILAWDDNDSIYYEIKQSDLYEGDKSYIRLMGSGTNNDTPIHKILNKIKNNGDNELSYYFEVNQGVVSGCDVVSKKLIKKLPKSDDIKIKDGIFVFDLENNRDFKVLNSFNSYEKEYVKDFYKNSEIGRFYSNTKASKKLLYLDRSITSIDNLPKIKEHLMKYYEIIKDRREVKSGQINYFNLQWSRKKEIFLGKKIVVPYRSKINTFAYNEIEWFCRSDCYVITKKCKELDLKYLLSLLNSKLFFIWLYYKGKRKGKLLELFQTPLSEVPIKEISSEKQKPFLEVVDKILMITKCEDYFENPDKRDNVEKLEKKIDQLVYDLYKLTPEEIKIVEEFCKEI